MVGFRYLMICLLLASCAQVGTISGGPKDEYAPKALDDKATPPNGTTRFTSKSVEIPFDEFFKLDQPNLNIRMVPPHANISSSVKGKTLKLEWEEDLQPNTTYAIYLNGAVKDITEFNDSIVQYVFSTGDQLDSISYKLTVLDAWTMSPVDNCVVGLFDKDTNYLRSFAETDQFGVAQLNYLHEGDYRLFAFIDENRDLLVQDHERIAFMETPYLRLDTSVVDSIPLRLYTPQAKPKITVAKYMPPYSIVLGATRDLVEPTVSINGIAVAEKDILFLASDSLRIFIDSTVESPMEVVLAAGEINDTVTVRLPFKATPTPITFSTDNVLRQYAPWDTIRLVCTDKITAVDASKIELMRISDSSLLTNVKVEFEQNNLFLLFERNEPATIDITFAADAVTTRNGGSTAYTSSITLLEERKFGAIKLDLSFYEGCPLFIEVMNGKKKVKTLYYETCPTITMVDRLSPGDYYFIVVNDANKNRRWDVGNRSAQVQPEVVDRYSNTVKVRANWEVELSLIPSDAP